MAELLAHVCRRSSRPGHITLTDQQYLRALWCSINHSFHLNHSCEIRPTDSCCTNWPRWRWLYIYIYILNVSGDVYAKTATLSPNVVKLNEIHNTLPNWNGIAPNSRRMWLTAQSALEPELLLIIKVWLSLYCNKALTQLWPSYHQWLPSYMQYIISMNSNKAISILQL